MEDFPPVFSFEEQENQVQASTTVDDKEYGKKSDEGPVEEAPDDASMLIPDEMDCNNEGDFLLNCNTSN